MIKRNKFVITFAFLFIVFPHSTLAGSKISLKLHGGLSYLQSGDINSGTQTFFDWGRVYFAPPPGGLIYGGYESIHLGYELGGDLIFELTPRIGIGIGAGYLESSKNPKNHVWMMAIVDNSGGEVRGQDFFSRTKLSAIPLRLSVFLNLPLSLRLNFVANAGASYYLKAKYHAFWYVDEQLGIPENPYQTLSTSAEERRLALGFQGGLGLEYRLWAKVALFVEAEGRLARFCGLEGTSLWEQGTSGGLFPPVSETGKLYYESVPMIPGSPRLIMVQSAPPAGPGGQPRGAVVDFSGVSLIAGVKIRL